MQDPFLLRGGEHDPPDMLADVERRPQCERARHVSFTVELREFSTRKLGGVLISDRNALPPQITSMGARDPERNRQFGPSIDLARRDLHRAYELAV
jgi:hypothetical protein